MLDELRTVHAEEQYETIVQSDKNIWAEADMSVISDPKLYKKTVSELSALIADLPEQLRRVNQSMMIIFEGTNAAYKSSCIRLLTDAVKKEHLSLFATKPPTPEEKSRHYLWQFWRTIPPVGHIAIYDRTWYNRVLFDAQGNSFTEEWKKRAYEEISDFEKTLTNNGYILKKFYLTRAVAPSPRNPDALTDKNAVGNDATADMLALTDTHRAPWNLICEENERLTHLLVLRHILKSVPLIPS